MVVFGLGLGLIMWLSHLGLIELTCWHGLLALLGFLPGLELRRLLRHVADFINSINANLLPPMDCVGFVSSGF